MSKSEGRKGKDWREGGGEEGSFNPKASPASAPGN